MLIWLCGKCFFLWELNCHMESILAHLLYGLICFVAHSCICRYCPHVYNFDFHQRVYIILQKKKTKFSLHRHPFIQIINNLKRENVGDWNWMNDTKKKEKKNVCCRFMLNNYICVELMCKNVASASQWREIERERDMAQNEI